MAMTALEYMEKKVNNHKLTYIRECARKAPEAQLENIRKKIGHYEAAVEALRKVGDGNG